MHQHPSKEELSGFLLGQLATDTSEVVAEHVEQCPSCRQTIQNLESLSDTLVDMLRKPSATDDAESQQVIERVVAVVENTLGDATQIRGRLNIPDERRTNHSKNDGNVPTRETFERDILASGTIDAVSWSQLQLELPALADAQDGAELAKMLAQHGALTKYQATVLCQGESGLRMGEYILLDQIGAGGMGQVFTARHRRMDRVVALKVLPKTAMNSPEAIKRFQREVKAAAKLTHPHIVNAYDASEQDGVHFLVMEYVAGHDLSSVIKRQGPLPVERVMTYLQQAALGLAFAHSKGVVHRDIKPANLLLDAEGTVKILDMGLARLDGDNANLAAVDELTYSGQVMGTADYMAPEQALDTRTADAKADVYSLGCTMYRLLTGRRVYQGETAVQKILAHREHPIPALESPHGSVPAALEALYRRMMAKKPEERPTMVEVAAELESLLQAAGVGRVYQPSTPKNVNAARTAASGDRVGGGSNGGRRPPLKFLAAAAGAAAVFLFGVWLIIRDKDGKIVAEIDAGPGTKLNMPEGGSIEVAASPSAEAPNLLPLPTDSALEFDGKSSYVVIPTLKRDQTSPVTIEAWVEAIELERSKVIVAFGGKAFCSLNLSDKNWFVNDPTLQSFLETPLTTGLVHLAFVADDQEGRLYVDGKLADRLPRTNELADVEEKHAWLGAGLHRGRPNYFFQGRLYEVSIAQVARYDQDFTPAKRFVMDQHTLALYHFDEGSGNELKDSSGNNHHGQIVGAKWVGNAAANKDAP